MPEISLFGFNDFFVISDQIPVGDYCGDLGSETIAFLTLGSRPLSSASASYIDSIETAVLKTSIGNAFFRILLHGFDNISRYATIGLQTLCESL